MPGARDGGHLRTALEAMRDGAYDTALRAVSELLAADPGDAALCQLGALAALKGGHHDAARMLARRSLSLEPAHGPTLIVYGRAAGAMGDDAEAAAAFRQAVEAMPDAAEPLFLLCAMLLRSGHPEARSVLEALEARAPEDASGWTDLGTLLAEGARFEAAIQCFERAADVAPSFDLAWRRGSALHSLGRHAEAADAFETATRLDPTSAQAHLMLARCRHHQGDDDAAASAVDTALRLDPTLAQRREDPEDGGGWNGLGELRGTFVV